jgi:hypothetical protein
MRDAVHGEGVESDLFCHGLATFSATLVKRLSPGLREENR